MQILVILFLAFIILTILKFPIAFAIGIPSLIVVYYLGLPLTIVITRIFGGIDSFSLMAIPFFILAGKIMEEAGITEKIVSFANALVGHLRGGLGHVNIVSSMILSGIQGSGVADASAIGSMMIPSMVKQGYDKDFSVVVTATSATIGPIIPPSIPLILYAFYTNQSVGYLFLGSAIPGIIIGFGLMGVCYLVSLSRGYVFREEKTSFKGKILSFFDSFGALIMPLIIVGGIVTGQFTATEAGVVAVVYGLFYGFVFTKKIKLAHLPNILISSAQMTATVMFVLALSTLFGHLLSRLGFQSLIMNALVANISNPYVFALLLMIILIMLGLFIDPVVLLVMFSPTLAAIGDSLGFDPIHFGVWVVIVILVGAITPPVGTILFVSCSVARIQIDKVLMVLFPFLAVFILTLIAVLFIPSLTLWLPSLF